jgi:hypothetical protein
MGGGIFFSPGMGGGIFFSPGMGGGIFFFQAPTYNFVSFHEPFPIFNHHHYLHEGDTLHGGRVSEIKIQDNWHYNRPMGWTHHLKTILQ